MTCLFFGTSTAELVTTQSGVFVLDTATPKAPYVNESVLLSYLGPELGLTTPAFSATVSDGWVSWYSYFPTTASANRAVMEISANGKGLFRLTCSANALQIQYHNDTSWQNSGTSFATLPGLYRFDFHFVIHDTTGTLTIYVNGEEKTSTTFAAGDTLLRGESAATNISVGPNGAGFNYNNFISAVMVHDEDTRIMQYVQKAIDGAGAETDWSGAYTDIDENGVSDTDLIQAGATADKATYTFAALPAALNAGWNVTGLGVNARAVKGTSSPANLQLAARHSTSNAFSASKALDFVFLPYQHVFPLNPSTSSPWTFTEADAAEVGVQAIT